MKINYFESIFPNSQSPEEWTKLLEYHLPLHGITEDSQVAMFLAQTGHESGHYTIFEENLNYSMQRLIVIFPKYFRNISDLTAFNRNPEKIANTVYANRMGNGDSASGDGYKFRGRGVLQITGKENYKKCSLGLYDDLRLLDNPGLVANNKEVALMTAMWFWDTHNLSANDSIAKVTQIINGGTNGLQQRIELYNKISQFQSP
jgi:putative chitinase